jgi:hypothetical protein
MNTDKDTLDEYGTLDEDTSVEQPETPSETTPSEEAPQALLAGKYKTPQELEKAYKELETHLGKKAEPELNPEQLKQMGFVTREELSSQQELQNFFNRYPQAKAKAEALNALKATEKYQSKSYEDIYKELYPDTPSESKRIVREVIIGDVTKTYNKSVYDMSPQEIDKLSDAELEALVKAESGSSSGNELKKR